MSSGARLLRHAYRPTLGIPPAGKQVTMRTINALCLENGKFVEHWPEQDNLELLQQLTSIPAPQH